MDHTDGGMPWWVWALTLAWVVMVLAAGWVLYRKAGQPGWTSVIPILNLVVLLRIVHKPWWWLLLMLIPFVNIVVGILILSALSNAFGKGLGMTLLLVLLTPIGYLVLGFGSAHYQLEPRPILG
ncbi:MAG: DUF5684 domain-containing protein [Candidatus Nanopelagicales bacterium]|jgi:uncharacterized membrane protein YoaK (UPF0700 family)|nr:DUF5684 domain-containing protein [Candidatus Nanopelagicales bacterium]